MFHKEMRILCSEDQHEPVASGINRAGSYQRKAIAKTSGQFQR